MIGNPIAGEDDGVALDQPTSTRVEVLDLDRTNRDLLHAADETRNELSETRKSEDQIKRLEAAMAAEKAEAAQERTRNNTAHGQCRVKFVGVRNSIWNRQGVGYFSEPD